MRREGPLAGYEADGPGLRGGTLGTAWAGRQRGPASGGLKGPQGGRGPVEDKQSGQPVLQVLPARVGATCSPARPCRCPSRNRSTG